MKLCEVCLTPLVLTGGPWGGRGQGSAGGPYHRPVLTWLTDSALVPLPTLNSLSVSSSPAPEPFVPTHSSPPVHPSALTSTHRLLIPMTGSSAPWAAPNPPQPFTPSPYLRSARARDPFLVLGCQLLTHSGGDTTASTHNGQGSDYLPSRRKVPEPASPGSLWGLDFLLPPAVTRSSRPLREAKGIRKELRISQGPSNTGPREPDGGGWPGWLALRLLARTARHIDPLMHPPSSPPSSPPPCPVLPSLPVCFLLGSTVLDHRHGSNTTPPTRSTVTLNHQHTFISRESDHTRPTSLIIPPRLRQLHSEV